MRRSRLRGGGCLVRYLHCSTSEATPSVARCVWLPLGCQDVAWTEGRPSGWPSFRCGIQQQPSVSGCGQQPRAAATRASRRPVRHVLRAQHPPSDPAQKAHFALKASRVTRRCNFALAQQVSRLEWAKRNRPSLCRAGGSHAGVRPDHHFEQNATNLLK